MGLFTGTDPTASWITAIVVLFVVTAVVALLLARVIEAARAIEGELATIWAAGQRVANNTIHIAALYRTKDAVEAILGRAGRIAESVEAIRVHAETCEGCPRCMLADAKSGGAGKGGPGG